MMLTGRDDQREENLAGALNEEASANKEHAV